MLRIEQQKVTNANAFFWKKKTEVEKINTSTFLICIKHHKENPFIFSICCFELGQLTCVVFLYMA